MNDFTLIMEKMAQGGSALSHLPDGRVCFVEGALTGETVHVQLTQQKKDFVKGTAKQILEPSLERVTPLCPLYGKCGGCSMQHASLKFQEQAARQVVETLFIRFAKEKLPENWKSHFGNPFHYRNRARFVRQENFWGFRGKESHEVIPLPDCPVLSPGLAHTLKEESSGWSKVSEMMAFDNGAGRVSLYHERMTPAERLKKSENEVSLLGRSLSMDASVFFQSNLGLLPELVKTVEKAAGEGKWLIDLFSGVGFFAAFLQDHFERVTTVERDANCLRHARTNLSSSCEEISGSAEAWLSENVTMGVDVLIVDPPRTGIPGGALQVLCKASPRKLLYVSCDPVTQARDFAILKTAGYRIADAHGFGFYPQTPHFEMFLELQKE
jgi:23S rRNA (uracil1939-C5)-methyltransferase